MRAIRTIGRVLGLGMRAGAMLLSLATAAAATGCRCDTDRSAGDRPAAVSSSDAAADGTDRSARPSRWPSLPTDAAALDQLIARHTQRPPNSLRGDGQDVGATPTADQLLALLRGRFRDGSVVAGWPSITRRLERRLAQAHQAGRAAVLLWGVYHDSSQQLAAFRRVTGPLGFAGEVTIVAEVFDADGRWSGVPASSQRGDDDLLLRYLARGEPAAFHQLLAGQRSGNYTAWKFGYLDEVMDLLVSARASGRPLLGCDMPSELQRRARQKLGGRTEQLRELHCALALRDAWSDDLTRTPIAVVWGQAHLGPERFERYLPKDAEVLNVRAFGARPGGVGVAPGLARRLAINAPVLLPTDELGRRLTLLLPGPQLSAQLDRVHEGEHCGLPAEQRQRLRLSSTAPGLFHIRDAKVDLDGDARSVVLQAGEHSFLFEADEGIMAGALTMPDSGQVDLYLDPGERTILLTQRSCASRGNAPRRSSTSAPAHSGRDAAVGH